MMDSRRRSLLFSGAAAPAAPAAAAPAAAAAAPAAPKPAAKKATPKLSFWEDAIMGGASASISKTISAPIERVKMMVQNQGEMLKQGLIDTPYKGVLDCFARTFRDEGFWSFWKSNGTNVIRYFPTQALNFAFKDALKFGIFERKKEDGYAMWFLANLASGGVAGAVSLCFVYSLDYARTKLASDTKSAKKGGERQYKGLIDVYAKTLKSDGIAGLYRGFVVSCVGIVIYRGFYFGLYDSIKPSLPKSIRNNFFANFAVGYGVTVVAGILSYPLDTIRRRMMMTSGTGTFYKSSIDCTMKVWKAEGFMSFFHGAGANVLRGIAGAGAISGFDIVKRTYEEWKFGTAPESKQ